jgi:hypothetical protein
LSSRYKRKTMSRILPNRSDDYEPIDTDDLEASKLNAQEYAAQKLGQINSKLDRVIELLEKLSART